MKISQNVGDWWLFNWQFFFNRQGVREKIEQETEMGKAKNKLDDWRE